MSDDQSGMVSCYRDQTVLLFHAIPKINCFVEIPDVQLYEQEIK